MVLALYPVASIMLIALNGSLAFALLFREPLKCVCEVHP